VTAATSDLSPSPSPSPSPSQKPNPSPRGDGRDEGPRRGGFPPDRRDSFDGPGGKGGGKGGGGGSPYGKGKGKDSGKGKGGGKGGGEGGMADPRSMKSYKDLDAPDDDDALFS
jgi:protein TonB